jgi:hypothetical protein
VLTGVDALDLAFRQSGVLGRLVAEDATAVEIVKLRLFAGLSVEEAANALGLARAMAYRHWPFARAWLRCPTQAARASALRSSRRGSSARAA